MARGSLNAEYVPREIGPVADGEIDKILQCMGPTRVGLDCAKRAAFKRDINSLWKNVAPDGKWRRIAPLPHGAVARMERVRKAAFKLRVALDDHEEDGPP
jgi:hypothetical protein